MPVDLIIEGAVAKVVLNRPERLNALTWEMRQQLREHFSELRFNEAVRAIIVTGEGRAFCTGADVGGMERKDLRGEREKLQQGSHSYMRVLTAIEKPVIAAVRGPTVGIGWSIAMGCDMIVASETARFSQNLPPDWAGAGWRRDLVPVEAHWYGARQGTGVYRAFCRRGGGTVARAWSTLSFRMEN